MRDVAFRACVPLDDDHELVIYFTGKAWTEYHPYGSTVAGEPLSEIEDMTRITLDGTEVTEEDLCDRFGADRVKVALDKAWDEAEEYDE